MPTIVENADVPTDVEELERLFDDHHQRVFRAAFRVTGNISDAEDVLQTVFLRLLRQEHPIQGFKDAANYLYRAGVNAAVDLLRSRRTAAQVSMEEAFERGREPAEEAQPLDEAAVLRESLRRAIARLHPTAAEMFVLRYFEGYENAEVARLMETSEGTVAVTLHRTRARLQRELAGEAK